MDIIYDFNNENDRKSACLEYSRLERNILSSSAEKRMGILDEMAGNAGLKFSMVNNAAYMHPHAFTVPKYELTPLEQEQDFADAVASISKAGAVIEH